MSDEQEGRCPTEETLVAAQLGPRAQRSDSECSGLREPQEGKAGLAAPRGRADTRNDEPSLVDVEQDEFNVEELWR